MSDVTTPRSYLTSFGAPTSMSGSRSGNSTYSRSRFLAASSNVANSMAVGLSGYPSARTSTDEPSAAARTASPAEANRRARRAACRQHAVQVVVRRAGESPAHVLPDSYRPVPRRHWRRRVPCARKPAIAQSPVQERAAEAVIGISPFWDSIQWKATGSVNRAAPRILIVPDSISQRRLFSVFTLANLIVITKRRNQQPVMVEVREPRCV